MNKIKLSNNFSLGEFLKSNTADRLGLHGQYNPQPDYITNMIDLCINVLQPLRDQLGQSIRITSGYRCKELNEAIGGSKTSDHSYGRAADIEIYIGGIERNDVLFRTIIELDLPFYQMISEFGTYERPNWIHIAYRKGDDKREILRAEKKDGKTTYEDITKNL
jgi:hypothetical protein